MRTRSFLPSGVALVVLAAMTPLSHAGQGRWDKSMGSGFSVLSVTSQDVMLMVRCLPADAGGNPVTKLWNKVSGEENHSSVAVALRTSEYSLRPVPRFRLTVAGHDYDGPLDTGTREGATRFTSLISDLRGGPAVVSYDGKTVSLPATGAAETLPDQAALRTTCKVD